MMRGFKSLLLSATAVSAASPFVSTVTVTEITGLCPVPETEYITSTLGTPITTPTGVSKTASKITSTPTAPYVYASDTSLPSGAPVATLTPKVHWGVDTWNPVHLIPQDTGVKQPLYYEDSGSAGKTPMALAGLAFTCPSVILDHSSLISSVTYSSGHLVIVFASEAAYKYALSLWECGDEGLFLVTYTAGCGGYADGERCYYKATTLHFSPGSLSVTAGGYACGLEDAITDIDLEWGYHKPPPKPVSQISYSSSYTARHGASSTSRSTYHHTSSSYAASFTSSYGGSPTSRPTYNQTLTSSSSAPSSTTSSNTTIVTGNNTFSDSCVAPVDTKYGLPVACLDEYFDLVLDNNFGYEDLNDTQYQAWVDAYASGTEYDESYDTFDAEEEADYTDSDSDDLFDFDDTSNSTVKERRQLARRALNKRLPSILKKIAKAIPIKGIGKDLTKQFSKAISFEIPKQSTLKNKDLKVVTSPWGEAILIKSFGKVKEKGDKTKGASMDIYCVDCGVSGSADLTGKLSASIANGISTGTVTLNANFKAGLKIGVDAQAVYKNSYDTTLFEIPLSPIAIPGIASLGPTVSLGAGVEFEAKAEGQLLAGAEFSMQDATSVIDMVDSTKSTSSGWTPQFVPVFQATGNLTVSAELQLPIAISVGVSILNGKWKKNVGLVDTPSLKAEAAISASIGLSENNTLTGGIAETNGCKGISTSISFKNTMYINILDVKKFWLLNPEYQPVKEGCITIGSSKTPTKTPTRSYLGLDSPGLVLRDDTTNTTNLTDVTAYVVSNITSLNYSNPVYPNNPYNTTNETQIYEYTILQDSFLTYNLTSCGDGNMYLQYANGSLNSDQCTSMWASQSDVVVGDATGRLLHYYPNTMNKLNVSRLRLSASDDMPGTSIPVFLNWDDSYETDSGDPIYYAVDPLDNIFYPVVCTYTNTSATAKIFLVADPDTGLELLQSKDVIYSITGGEVDTCFYLPLIQGNDDEDSWDDYDEDLENDDDDDEDFEYSDAYYELLSDS